MMVSLGCSKNRVDAEEMLGLLQAHGHNIVTEEEKADIVVVNTCGFIEKAKQESIDEVLHYAKLKDAGKIKYIIMTGCLAQRYVKELKEEIPEVDAFVGVTAFQNIARTVEQLGKNDNIDIRDINDPCALNLPRITNDYDVYAYLKIAEGCDNRCSYCAIPYIRGKFRSKPLDVVVNEAKELAARGKKEIIVVAQDITRYGQDLDGNINLKTLLQALSDIDGIEWIRMMYLNPTRVSCDFIDFVAENKKVLPYFDIPIQHINNRVLRLMNREADSQKIRDIFAYIKKRIPESSLRTTFISGFPGETEDESKEIVEFIKTANIENLGVFTFSEEEGTPAVDMDGKVSEETAQKRANRIMAQQKRIVSKLLKSRCGEELNVIIEGQNKNGKYYGRSYRQAPEIDGMVFVNSEKPLKAGDIVSVRITSTYNYDSEGDLI